jgi:dihydropteroate synthase
VAADLVIPAADAETLREIVSWDGHRAATFAASDFPVDILRFEGSSSPPVAISRARRAETLKAFPASLRTRAEGAFALAARRPAGLRLAHGRRLDLAEPAVMGVINVTPDSFSDGGVHFDRDRAIEAALRMFEDGAAIVDVGGESTRPSTYGEATELSAEEESSRVVPVIAGIRERSAAPLSVDTRKAEVARRALEAGADLVNDVSGLRFDEAMARVIAEAGAGAILMHMRGLDPRTMQDDVSYAHPLADVATFLSQAIERAAAAGTPADAIAVDPGLGFGKSPEGNLLLLRHLAAFASLGCAIAVGASRKAFIRRFSGLPDDAPPADRLPGSLAALSAAAAGGARILRVHDVRESVRFLRMAGAVARAVAAPKPAGAAVR